MTEPTIAILDFGAQYAQLIARRVRENHVHSRLVAPTVSADALRADNVVRIILSGGPSSVYDSGAPKCDPGIFEMGGPELGICYGFQVACHLLGGKIKPGKAREYGRTRLQVQSADTLLAHVPSDSTVWMSHGDVVDKLSEEFIPMTSTPQCPVAVVRHRMRPIY